MKSHSLILSAAFLLQAALFPQLSMALSTPTPPESFFKQPPGTDYYLANYSEYEGYLKRLARESDRMKLVDIGKTAEGRTQWMAIVSSPENISNLERYRAISEKLARAKNLDPKEARNLANMGKAVVWIDAGLHATETVTSQGQIQVIYKMLTQTDPETIRILKDVIILFAHDNPDGMELVSDWYMRHSRKEDREFEHLPRLYQKYVGHDNNRDSFMVQMPETENINRVLFRDWYPQIVYNQHQTAPAGMVVFVPPFRDPFNFNYDPIVMAQLDEVASVMHSRLLSEGKAGSGKRGAAPYSTWHNGMVRSVSYFHNAIGLLTEITGGPTPTTIPLVPSTQLPRGDEIMPIGPQEWHLQDTLNYQYTLNMAVLDYASRNRERLLFNIYRMAANSIEKGSRDNWTVLPSNVDALAAAAPYLPEGNNEYQPRDRDPKLVDPALYQEIMQSPENRDPRAYVISPDQRDFPTAIAFLNALIKNGVDVEKAENAFNVGNKTYPAGSYVVRTAQAYRPHIMDMFEPQEHPHDEEYPGGPPKPPYDVTGYTLAFQMGVSFDRVFEGVEGAFSQLSNIIMPPAGKIEGQGAAGWIVSHDTNNSFILTNRLLKAGIEPSWLTGEVNIGGETMQPGALWIPASDEARLIVVSSVTELGISATAVNTRPSGEIIALKPVRLGLVDRYGGVIPVGWTRWLLEEFEFSYELVFPQRLDQGGLSKDFDVLLFADRALPSAGAWGESSPETQPDRGDIPREYRHMLGEITDEKTVPAITEFVRGGGAVVALGSAGRFSQLFDTPLEPALAQTIDGIEIPLDSKQFFIPGSILRAQVDNSQPLAYGLPDEVDIFFNRSQTFELATVDGDVNSVSWFEGRDLLRSGWAIGEEQLAGTIAIADVSVGDGKLFLLGPQVAQRAQSYGTFKFLFNALLYSGAE